MRLLRHKPSSLKLGLGMGITTTSTATGTAALLLLALASSSSTTTPFHSVAYSPALRPSIPSSSSSMIAFIQPSVHRQQFFSTSTTSRVNAGGKRSGGEDKISRNRKKSDLPEKVCVVCGRPFTWRKKWEKVWDEVKYCSERCRRHRGEAAVSDGTATSRRGALSLGASILGGIMLMGTSGPQPAMASSALRPAPGEIEKALKDVEWPDEIPFTGEDFARLDTSDDALFYDTPKLVEHIDKPAQVAMQKFYNKFFTSLSETMGVRNKNLDVLDLCSSWVSHFPPSYETKSSRVAGLGMNEGELKLNPVLTEYRVQDLNKDPKLPYEDKSFDAVVCALSIDYLNKPLKVVREMARVLRPGGAVAIVFSNRLFITKAVGVWTGADDVDHAYTVGAYIHYGAKDLLSPPEALDLSPSRRDGDPLYAVIAYRRSA